MNRPCLLALLLLFMVPGRLPAVENTGIDPDAVLESNFRFFSSDDLRKSIKWKGYVAALELAAGGDWARAREFVFKLREFIPGNVMLMEQEARLRMREEEWALAEQIWYELFSRQPHRQDVLPELAWVLLQQDKDEEALRICSVVLNRNPRQVEARLIRAILALRASGAETLPEEQWNMREMAHLCQLLGSRPRGWIHFVGEEEFRTLVAQAWAGGARKGAKPSSAPLPELTRQNRGNAAALIELEKAMALRQNERARTALDRLLAGGMTAPLFQGYRAYLLGREGREEEAEALFAHLLTTYPAHRQIRHMWAALLVELGRGEDAREALAPLKVSRDSDPDLQFLQLLVALQTDAEDEAWGLFHHLAAYHRGDLLRLLRQEEPLLDSLRSDARYLKALRTPPVKKESESTP